jgi:proteic killer suppression protein
MPVGAAPVSARRLRRSVIRWLRVIQSFRSKDTAKLAAGFRVGRFIKIERAAQRKLAMLAAATDVNDLRVPPSNHLEKLHGDRTGQYSIRINDPAVLDESSIAVRPECGGFVN